MTSRTGSAQTRSTTWRIRRGAKVDWWKLALTYNDPVISEIETVIASGPCVVGTLMLRRPSGGAAQGRSAYASSRPIWVRVNSGWGLAGLEVRAGAPR